SSKTFDIIAPSWTVQDKLVTIHAVSKGAFAKLGHGVRCEAQKCRWHRVKKYLWDVLSASPPVSRQRHNLGARFVLEDCADMLDGVSQRIIEQMGVTMRRDRSRMPKQRADHRQRSARRCKDGCVRMAQ